MVLSRTGVASLALLAAALVFGITLGFVLAFGSGGSDPWEERWADLGVPEAEFVFLGNLTGREQESIRRELKVAQVVFAEHFGAVTSDFKVYVSPELDALNERYSEHVGQGAAIPFTCGGRAPRGAIFLVVEGCRDAIAHGALLAHEYFHILQHEAGPLDEDDYGLYWLIEGPAEYARGLVNETQGRRSLAATRKGLQLAWSAGLLKGIRYTYHYGFLATDRLVEGAGGEAILEFFRLGADQTAFESVFGMPSGVFQSSFDAYLRVVVPSFEWRVGGTVLGSDGLPAEGATVYALVRTEGEAWNAGRGETGPEGDFEFAAPGNGYTLGVWLQCPRDDIAQWLFAGEWGANGFVGDADGFLHPHSRGAKPFEDGERDRTGMVIELPETRESLIAEHCES